LEITAKQSYLHILIVIYLNITTKQIQYPLEFINYNISYKFPNVVKE